MTFPLNPKQITDDIVERATQAAYEACYPGAPWGACDENRAQWLKTIRAGLAALCDRRVKERRAVSAKNAHTEMADIGKPASEQNQTVGGRFTGYTGQLNESAVAAYVGQLNTDVERQPAASPERSCGGGVEPTSRCGICGGFMTEVVESGSYCVACENESIFGEAYGRLRLRQHKRRGDSKYRTPHYHCRATDRPGVAVATGESSTARQDNNYCRPCDRVATEPCECAQLHEDDCPIRPSPTEAPKAGVQDCGAGVETYHWRSADVGPKVYSHRRASDRNGLAVATPDTRTAPQDKPNTAPKSIPEVSEGMRKAGVRVWRSQRWGESVEHLVDRIFEGMLAKHLEEQGQ